MNKCLIKLTLAAGLLSTAIAGYAQSAYNSAVMADRPVMFLNTDAPQSDLSGNGITGSFVGGTPAVTTLPNGERASVFNGSSQYITVAHRAALSVPTTRSLSFEAWMKPSTLNFSRTEAEGYVYWMGKGNPSQGYEYANRMYSQNTDRPNRISVYHWNKDGGLGSGAYFQEPVSTSQWIHVVSVVNMNTGYITLYKNGVLKGRVPLSQYNVTPQTTTSPFNIGTRNGNSWFYGAIGKVAVYNYELPASRVAAHYQAMSQGGTVVQAPALSNVAAGSLAANGAAITWNTDKPAYSQVEYGLTTTYGSQTTRTTSAVGSHNVALTGLQAGRVYHYRAKSFDPATGLTGQSADGTFTTAAAAAPVISAVSAVPSQTGAVVKWTTDKAATSQVEYGLTTTYGSQTAATTATGTSHSVTLSNLQAGKVYHYRVKSKDSAGLTGVSQDFTFTTPAAQPPVISAVTAVPSNTGVSISWMTDKVSNSQVEYGFTSAYGQQSYSSVATGLSHNVVLSGLTAGRLYHYRVKSKDAAGNTGVSGDFTFTTTGGTTTPPPTNNLLTNVRATNVTASGANITWTSSVVSNSQVEYGTTTSYGSQSYSSTATGLQHWIPLSGLRAGTTYHYRVKSRDAAGVVTTSVDYTFRTSGGGGTGR